MAVIDLDMGQVTFLAFIQGLTEFLPISSSAHLLLPTLLLDWPDQGLTFDVAVHVGTLIAVLLYFQADIRTLFVAWCRSLAGRHDRDSRLAWHLILATLPAGLSGLLLNDWIEDYARSALVIGTTSIVFALLLFASDLGSRKDRGLDDVTWRQALFIGFAQVLALVPGTSRSGITMTAGLLCRLSRRDAARFSFLLAIPIIFASGLLRAADLVTAEAPGMQWSQLLYAATLSGLIAYACIHYFLRLIERVGYLPFVIYRVLLGILLLGLFWLL